MAKCIKAGIGIRAIGLDLADVWSDWVGLDERGDRVECERVKTTESELRKVFGAMAPTTIALEVGTHSRWVSRVLGSLGHTVVVANARKVALIHRNKRKTNRIDAEFLARLVRAERHCCSRSNTETNQARQTCRCSVRVICWCALAQS